LKAKELARHLYCEADVLPRLKVLEVKRVVAWKTPSYEAYARMGPQYEPALQPYNVKHEAEVSAVQQ
jgi:hypothetical protein